MTLETAEGRCEQRIEQIIESARNSEKACVDFVEGISYNRKFHNLVTGELWLMNCGTDSIKYPPNNISSREVLLSLVATLNGLKEQKQIKDFALGLVYEGKKDPHNQVSGAISIYVTPENPEDTNSEIWEKIIKYEQSLQSKTTT